MDKFFNNFLSHKFEVKKSVYFACPNARTYADQCAFKKYLVYAHTSFNFSFTLSHLCIVKSYI